MDAVVDIARKLKEARKLKGLSQRALAKLAGMPQSHISKIETTGVDLRISSLTEIARALDLELVLVPRKTVPAVKSIVRSAQSEIPSLTRLALNDDLARLEKLADKIAEQYSSVKEAAQLQSRVHDLTRFPIPDSYLNSIRQLQKELEKVYKHPDLKHLISVVDHVQTVRNELVHFPPEEFRRVSRSAYSLEDEDA